MREPFDVWVFEEGKEVVIGHVGAIGTAYSWLSMQAGILDAQTGSVLLHILDRDDLSALEENQHSTALQDQQHLGVYVFCKFIGEVLEIDQLGIALEDAVSVVCVVHDIRVVVDASGFAFWFVVIVRFHQRASVAGEVDANHVRLSAFHLCGTVYSCLPDGSII